MSNPFLLIGSFAALAYASAKSLVTARIQPQMPETPARRRGTVTIVDVPTVGNKKPASQFSLSANGLEQLKEHEGFREVTYDDVTGKPVYPGDSYQGTLTIGFGHTGPDVVPGLQITRAQATSLLQEDIAWAEQAVRDGVDVLITQDQFDAMVSFVYNIGRTNFMRSSFRGLVNQSRFEEAAANMVVNWHRGNGIPNALTGRREKEAALFLSHGGGYA